MKNVCIFFILSVLLVLVSCGDSTIQKEMKQRGEMFDSALLELDKVDSIYKKPNLMSRDQSYVIFAKDVADAAWGYFIVNRQRLVVEDYELVIKMPDKVLYPDTCHVVIRYRDENDSVMHEIPAQGITNFFYPMNIYSSRLIQDKRNIRIKIGGSNMELFENISDSTLMDVYFPQAKHNTGYEDLNEAFDKIGFSVPILPRDRRHIIIIRDLYKKFKQY